MQARYGNYVFPANEAGVATSTSWEMDAANLPYRVTTSVSVTGQLGAPGDDQYAISSKMNALRTALTVPGLDFALLHDDGSVSAIYLLSRGSLTGVRLVDGPNFPLWQGAEHATYKTYTFTLAATYLAPSNSPLVQFAEQLSFSGGGPRYGFIESLRDLPVKQLEVRKTVYRAVQSGSALGRFAYPVIPPPIWPADLVEAPQVTQVTPTREGVLVTGYPVTWSYTFASTRPLVGVPNLWRV